jgi:hypothetical protein
MTETAKAKEPTVNEALRAPNSGNGKPLLILPTICLTESASDENRRSLSFGLEGGLTCVVWVEGER